MNLRMCPPTAAILALAAALLSPAIADSPFTTTNTLTVDTRGTGDLTVTGRVLDAATGMPLSGATATLGGLAATSASNGTFAMINYSPAGGATLIVSATGYLSQARAITAPAGSIALDVGDLALAPDTNKPVVEVVKPDLAGMYLQGWGLTTTLRIRVNWNGNTPGEVQVYGNHQLRSTLTGSGPDYAATMPIDSWFVASGLPGTNSVRVVARGSDANPLEGEKSLDIAVLPFPQSFGGGYLPDNQTVAGNILKLKLGFPAPAIRNTVSLPLIGEFGGELQGEGELSYNLSSGAWDLRIGGPGSHSKVLLGGNSVAAGLTAAATGTATLEKGLAFDGLSLTPSLGISGAFRVGAIRVPDLFGTAMSDWLTQFAVLRPVMDHAVIAVMAKPSLTGQAEVVAIPNLKFNDFQLTGKAPLEGFFESKISGIKVRFDVGGGPSVSFQYPGDFFKDVGFRGYAAVNGRIFAMDLASPEYVFVDSSFVSDPGGQLPEGWVDTGSGYMIPAAANGPVGAKPMERPWRETGGEQLLANASPGALDVFNRMGQAVAPGAVYVPVTVTGEEMTTDPSLTAQATLPLVSNVFPDAEPALAASGNSLMLLYARDTGAANPLQFTEIACTRYDGTTWSAPAAVAPAANGQFNPQVAFDGNGDAVAVWEQFNDAAMTSATLEEAASHMEIMWARWNPATGSWSAPQAMTSNGYLDRQPRLAGPLSDGSLVLTWIANQGNLLSGEGPAGSPGNDQVMVARWLSSSRTWQSATVLVPDLSGDVCHSLAANAGKVVYVWGLDIDGDRASTSDTELFYRVMDAEGNWSAATRLTNDLVVDTSARVVIDTAGSAYLVWQRGGDLVMQRDFTGSPSVIRADSGSPGAADFSLAIGPGGSLVVIWQDISASGADAHYRVFDPASGTWSLDAQLTSNRDLECSFAPVWDASGNLVLAYTHVATVNQTKTVDIGGGATVSVEGVPQPGQVDLLLAKRALVMDLSFAANSLTSTGAHHLPGDAITLKAKVRNNGNVAVQEVAVAFYNGNPAAGGTLIQTATVPGWLQASAEAEVSVDWTLPEPAIARTVYAVVDPSGVATEASETNNQLSLPLNGVNLQLEYVSGSVLPDGSARVVARVTNLSAPESPVSRLRWKQQDGTGSLAEIEVTQLAPGTAVEIPLDLPAGSHPQGVRAYRLSVDEEAISGDVDASNNTVLFTLSLWIDGDGDGVPQEWEAANGMSDADAADAALDTDGDGFTNRQEYFAGTDPRNRGSFLMIGELARRVTANGLATQLSWASVSGRSYRVERSYDLDHWETLQDGVVATPPLNTVADDQAPPAGKAFYRLTALGD